jgi:hypothetical protein
LEEGFACFERGFVFGEGVCLLGEGLSFGRGFVFWKKVWYTPCIFKHLDSCKESNACSYLFRLRYRAFRAGVSLIYRISPASVDHVSTHSVPVRLIAPLQKSPPHLLPSFTVREMTTITTPLTKLFGIKHPIFLAGMNVAAGPGLAAAVTNAGGMGIPRRSSSVT